MLSANYSGLEMAMLIGAVFGSLWLASAGCYTAALIGWLTRGPVKWVRRSFKVSLFAAILCAPLFAAMVYHQLVHWNARANHDIWGVSMLLVLVLIGSTAPLFLRSAAAKARA